MVNEGYAVEFDPDEVDKLGIIYDPAVDTDEDIINQFETAEEIEAYIQMCEEKYYGE